MLESLSWALVPNLYTILSCGALSVVLIAFFDLYYWPSKGWNLTERKTRSKAQLYYIYLIAGLVGGLMSWIGILLFALAFIAWGTNVTLMHGDVKWGDRKS